MYGDEGIIRVLGCGRGGMTTDGGVAAGGDSKVSVDNKTASSEPPDSLPPSDQTSRDPYFDMPWSHVLAKTELNF